MKRMTIGQLDEAVGREAPIYIQSADDSVGDQLVELTNYLRGNSCILSWEVTRLYTLEGKAGYVAQVDLPEAVVAVLDVDN